VVPHLGRHLEIGTRQSYVGFGLLIACVIALLTANLSGFGIWDPWELNAADAARRMVDHQAATTPGATPFAAVVALGFRILDVREWTGRLPIALCGALTSALAFLLVRRFAGNAVALLAAFITATTPLFLLGSRLMLGEAPGFALQGLIATGGAIALFESDEATSLRRRTLWFSAMFVAVLLASATRGALLGAVPPLGAVAAVALLQHGRGTWDAGARRGLAVATTALATVTAFMSARAVIADHAEATFWIGAAPRSLKPASFDSLLESVFHSFAPWSALLPVALGRLVTMRAESAEERDHRLLGWVFLLWIALGYGTQLLFVSRYGEAATFLPVIALSGSVALLLQDAQTARFQSRAGAFVALLFAGLLIRDFGLYPGGPIEALPIAGFELPKAVNPREAWAAGLLAFGFFSFVALSLKPGSPTDLRAPYLLLAVQWRRNLGTKIWLSLAALGLLACVVGGLAAWIAPQRLHMSTLATKVAKGSLALPIALPIAIAAAQLVHRLLLRAYDFRLVPTLVIAAAMAIYIAHGFLPTLSAHFSPREVYEAYNSLATDSDALAEYRVGGRAATYYARGQVIDVEHQAELLRHLSSKQRRWAAFPSEDLATIDHQHRRATGEHLFVIDAGSARITLATNQPIPNRANASFLVRNVLKTPPTTIQHPTHALFEDKIELLGYDLELPHGEHVGASESFVIKWYFRALKPIGGNYKIFLHVDGQGLRLNGDHEPIDGKYPVRMWDPNDVIVDQQELTVPANYRAGAYTLFLGFFSGNTRLKVVEGPKDDADRVRAGTLRIQ